jgi:hypothetical protein
MGAWKRVMLAALIMGGMAACDDADDTSAQDTTNQSGPSGISTACLKELPEPSVDSQTPARLNLTLSDFVYSFEEGRHRFTHDRRFKESAGIGLFIYRGKVCVEDGTSCADACVRYRIEPGGSLTQRDHHFATPLDPDRITLQYWARDDAGHVMTLKQEIQTKGRAATVMPN